MWSAIIIDLMTFKACYFKYTLFADSGLQLKEELLLGNTTKQFVKYIPLRFVPCYGINQFWLLIKIN